MRIVRNVFGVLLLAGVGLLAQQDDLPCKIGGFKVAEKKVLYLDCQKVVRGIEGKALLTRKDGGTNIHGTIGVEDLSFVRVELSNDLEKGAEYDVDLEGTFGAAKTPFKLQKPYTISTKQDEATLASPVLISTKNPAYGSELILESSIELSASAKNGTFYSEDAPGMFAPHAFDPNQFPVPLAQKSPAKVGTGNFAFLSGDRPKSLDRGFKLKGIEDIFGQPLKIKMKKRLALPSAPKGKDDSFYYIKLLHQAGASSKPALILDGKIDFREYLGRGYFFSPVAIADVGQGGSIGSTKTNDAVQLGAGVGKFFRTATGGALQGVEPVSRVVYETNYALEHKNVLFTEDLQWFLGGTDRTLKQQNYEKYIGLKKTNKDGEPQDVPRKAIFGYQFQFFTGVEVGGRISDDSAQSSDKTTRVAVPTYKIARVKPKVALALEVWRVTFNLSGESRYLLTTENVYRERTELNAQGKGFKQIYLDKVAGFRPGGQAGITIALDNAGHFGLSTTLKVGSLPPNFQRVAIVQSGLVIKY